MQQHGSTEANNLGLARSLCSVVKQREMNMRMIRFSMLVKEKFSEKVQSRIADQFEKDFRNTGRRFIEKDFAGEILICNLTPKIFHIMLEIEW